MGLIRECGLLFRGYTLINSQYHEFGSSVKDKDLRSGLLTAIIDFSGAAFSTSSLEYIEGKKKVIFFTRDSIFSGDEKEKERILAYVIADKDKNVDKEREKIIPDLKKLLTRFVEQFNGSNLSYVSEFERFKKEIDEVFGAAGTSVDQRLKGVFY
jgi:hypothetical protein